MTVLDKEYAVYRNDEIIAMGTAYECAKEMGVTPEYIHWMTTPTGKKRLATRKDQVNAQTAIALDDEEELS